MLFREACDYLYFLYLLYYLNQSSSIELRRLNLNFSYTNNNHFKRLPSASLPCLKIVGFCLLPNSFSLVVKQLQTNGISDFMQRLGTSYSLHYNKKYSRSGPIFCGPFKSVYIEKNVLNQALLFIHLQPSKLFIHLPFRKLSSQVNNYNWSSLPYYLGKMVWSPLLNKNKRLHPSLYTQTMKNAIFKKNPVIFSCSKHCLNDNVQKFILNINNLFNILLIEIFINSFYFLDQIQNCDLG